MASMGGVVSRGNHCLQKLFDIQKIKSMVCIGSCRCSFFQENNQPGRGIVCKKFKNSRGVPHWEGLDVALLPHIPSLFCIIDGREWHLEAIFLKSKQGPECCVTSGRSWILVFEKLINLKRQGYCCTSHLPSSRRCFVWHHDGRGVARECRLWKVFGVQKL